jgi:hypothetical protein
MSIILRDATVSSQLAEIDSNGNVHVTEATASTTSGATGSAVPAASVQVAGSDGTDLRTIKTDATGRQIVLLNGARTQLGVFSVQSTSASLSSLIAAGTGFNDIVTLNLTNEGTATLVTISDGTNSYVFALGAAEGLNINFSSTLPAASSAVAWQISNSAAQTVDANGVYVKN